MPRPCRVLTVPFLTAFILLGWELPNPEKYDFSSRPDLKKIWLMFRIHIRNKNFLKMTENFRVDNITDAQLKLVKKIMNVHKDMTFPMIIKECGASAYLFLWTQQVIEYMKVKKSMEAIGVKQIEDKMEHYEDTSKAMLDVFDRILSNQEF